MGNVVGWLLAIVLALLLRAARRDLKALRRESELASPAAASRDRDPGTQVDSNLIVLRLQLVHLRDEGKLDDTEFVELTGAIDTHWRADDRHGLPAADTVGWWQACDAAWNAMRARNLVPYGPPPWRPEPQPPQAPKVPESATTDAVWQPVDTGTPTTVPPPSEVPDSPRLQPPPIPEAAQPPTSAPATTPTPAPAPDPAAPVPHVPEPTATPAFAHALRRSTPGPLERALHRMSDWPKALMPFLVQNIGWFIGGFLFLAGSVFLVTYTTGFAKAAIVFASLFGYAVFLIWAGYKLRLTRPRLNTASGVLLTTGLLLVPLTLSAVVRLMINASGSALLWLLAIGAAALSLAVFYYAAQLVTGIVHRSLRGDFPRLFLGLAAAQLVAPLVARLPYWPMLAGAHLALLALLGYGLVRFANEWLQSIFVDRKKIAYLAAGALFFATLTSFVHITWGVESVVLPQGYYAPYLLLVCGLLFFLDARLKAHTHDHVFLSRLSFLVYGLSVVAVLMALGAPAARLVTLGLAAVLYGFVLWKYLTLIPLYLMVVSLAGLYGFAVLAHVSAAAHLLVSMPGLFALSALSRWATVRGGERPPSEVDGLRRVGIVNYRMTLVLLAGLGVWSIANSEPGLLGMATGLVLAGSLWWLLGAVPAPILRVRATAEEASLAPAPVKLDLRDSPWLYAPMTALAFAAVLAPPLFGPAQFAAALMLLALLQTAVLRYERRAGAKRLPIRTEVFANCALLSVFAASALAALGGRLALTPMTVAVLATGAGVLLTLAFNLYNRVLFYAFLAWAALTAVLVKLTWFPSQSAGLTEMLGGAALWALLWWLDRQPEELSDIARRRAWRGAPRRLLWSLSCAPPEDVAEPATESLPEPRPEPESRPVVAEQAHV